jgi:hypothetical protein
MFDAAGRQGVITNHLSILANDEGAGCAGNIILESAVFKPYRPQVPSLPVDDPLTSDKKGVV